MAGAVLVSRPGVAPDDAGGGEPARGEGELLNRREALLAWLAGQPLVPPAAGLAAGIALDSQWRVPFAACLILFMLCGAAIVRRRVHDGLRHLAILLAALALGAALHDVAFRRWAADHVIRYCGREPLPARLTATVLDAPLIRPVQTGRIEWYGRLPRTRMLVSAERLEGVDGHIPVSGTVSVMIREPVLHVAAGDRVELFGILQRPKPPTNPGERDWRLAQRRSGVLVQMTCELSANVAVQERRRAGFGWLSALRRAARMAMLEGAYPADVPGSQLLSAMVLGQRSAVSPALNEAFVRTGTVHYLSVSGAHVGMLASVAWLGVILLGRPKRSACIAVMVLITLYAILAEPRPPILRAAIMGNVLCLALLSRRPVRSANWLAASALILLAVQPTQLFSPAFQLSFLTLIAVIHLSPRAHAAIRHVLDLMLRRDDPLLQPRVQRMLGPVAWWRRAGWRVEGVVLWPLSIGISAWLAGLVPSAYHFQQIAMWGWLNTLLVLPFVWLALVLGLLKTVVAGLFAPAAGLLSLPLVAVTDGLVWLVGTLARLPGSGVAIPHVPPDVALAGLAVLGAWACWPWLRVSGHWIAIAGLAFMTLAAWRLAPPGPADSLKMYVLSVGHGTATVIQLPNGRTLMYDMGARPPYDVERWTAGPLLARDRIWRTDAFILSHLHLDHFSGLPDLVHRRWVGSLIRPPDQEAAEGPAASLLAELKRSGLGWHQVIRGDRLTGTGEVAIDVLWPPSPAGGSEWAKEGRESSAGQQLDMPSQGEPQTGEGLPSLSLSCNDGSIVLSITYRGRRILLCGDIEDLAQRELLARGGLKADVLVLPHHGGVVRSTGSFIEAVNPILCVRSTGYRDTQSRRLLALLDGYGYLSTAEHGTLEIEIGPQGGLDVRPWGRGDVQENTVP